MRDGNDFSVKSCDFIVIIIVIIIIFYYYKGFSLEFSINFSVFFFRYTDQWSGVLQ